MNASLDTAGEVRPELAAARRVVVKIGSALLVDQESGDLRRAWLDAMADDVTDARARGQEVVLVSSGAIALGRRKLGLPQTALPLDESQAAAAVGQIQLAHAYQETLARHGIATAQVLVTLQDTEERRRYLNARGTLRTLLRLGVVPVINENDTVATDEIRVGDNDRLAARVAQMVDADLLVLLSDIDGLYTADPRRDPTATFLPTVRGITPEIEAMAGTAGSTFSKGGMITKIAAAKICLGAGCAMAITEGKRMNALGTLDKGARATWFLPDATPRTARKHWIAGSLQPRGRLIVDAGAANALAHGSSLLPAGVRGVVGEFHRGDAVLVEGPDGREIGRGLVAYGADDMRTISGHRSGEIEGLLGYHGRDEAIHRDDFALT